MKFACDVESGVVPGPAPMHEQQQPKKRVRIGTGPCMSESPFLTSQIGAAEDDDEAPVGTFELRAALNGLVDDIYAICVRYIVACYDTNVPKSYKIDMRMKIAWLLCAAVFCFLLQITLVTLLWNAASAGNSPVVRPATEKLWQQVGVAHQLLCRWQQWQKQYNKGKNESEQVFLPDILDCDCSEWWPGGKKTLAYTEAKACLSLAPSNITKHEICKPAILGLNSSWTAYGRGLFFNRSTLDDEPKVDRAANETQLFLGEKLDPVVRIDPVFFIMFAYMQLAIVVHQEFKQGIWLCYIAAGCVGILPPFFGQLTHGDNSEWRIIDHDHSSRQIPWFLKVFVVLVPLLQLLCALAVLATGGVLFLFEQNQTDAILIIINSVALAFILDVDNRIGAIISLREYWAYPKTGLKNATTQQMRKQDHLAEQQQAHKQQQPVYKKLTGRLQTLWGSMFGIKTSRHEQAAAPAPGGPTVGPASTTAASADLTGPTVSHSGSRTNAAGCTPRAVLMTANCTRRLPRPCLKQVLGYVYIGILGALIYAEVMFLAPQSAAQLLSFVVLVLRRVGRVDTGAVAVTRGFGLPAALLGNPDTPTTDWFYQGLWYHWSFGGWMDGYFEAKNQVFTPRQPFTPSPPPAFWIIMAYISFLVCSVLFVVLLCVRILPSCTRYWTVGLLVTQIWVLFLAQFQDATFNPKCNLSETDGGYLSNTTLPSIYKEPLLSKCPRYFWWLVLLGNSFFCWLVMFIIVPARMEFCCSRGKQTSCSLTEPAAGSAAQPGSPGRDESFYTANSKDVGQGYTSPGTR